MIDFRNRNAWPGADIIGDPSIDPFANEFEAVTNARQSGYFDIIRHLYLYLHWAHDNDDHYGIYEDTIAHYAVEAAIDGEHIDMLQLLIRLINKFDYPIMCYYCKEAESKGLDHVYKAMALEMYGVLW